MRRNRSSRVSETSDGSHVDVGPVPAQKEKKPVDDGQNEQKPIRRSQVLNDLEAIFESKVIMGRKSKMPQKPAGGLLFRHLPPIEAYQQALQFPVDAPGRVILRLERLMGTSNIRPNDRRYMKKLRGKLEKEEEAKWETRRSDRKDREYERCQKLVIDGHCDPPEGMEEITKHPVYRVNRIMHRLVDIDVALEKDFHINPPPIKQLEPFEEYRETGFLFGSHPGHYLKVKGQQKTPPTEEEKEEEPVELMFHSPQFDANGKLLPPEKVPSPKPSSMKAVGVEPTTRPNSPEPLSGELERDEDQKSLNAETVRADIEAAKKKYGINPDDIERMWKAYDSPLIKMIDDEEECNGLFDTSDKVLGTGQRENRFTDAFITKTYQQLLMSPRF